MTEQAAPTKKEAGGGAGVFIALAPWILFTIVAEHGTLKAASITALVAAIAIVAHSRKQGSAKVLEVAAVAAFAGFVAVAFLADASLASWVERYARAIAAGLLALIAITSVMTVPFTEQYAREQVPREYWGAPAFRALNRKLSLVWAFVFAVMVPGHVVAGIVNTRPTDIVLNWVVPVMLVLWGMKRMSEMTASEAH